MIGEAYDIIETKTSQIDSLVQDRFGEQIAGIYTRKYNKLFACLEPLKHDQEKQYLECLQKYEKQDLNISHLLKSEKETLYTCVNTTYKSAQIHLHQNPNENQQQLPPKFSKQLDQCLTVFEKNVISTVEKAISASSQFD